MTSKGVCGGGDCGGNDIVVVEVRVLLVFVCQITRMVLVSIRNLIFVINTNVMFQESSLLIISVKIELK